ncbi:putative cytochrome P450 [Poronia punctata]|nr:putative cytochrome P450 [Poronia punctata]
MLSAFTLVAIVVAGGILYSAAQVIYRLYFHPLSHYPGPKLAAATWWYEAYYDAWLYGQFTFQVQKLHEVYGPIVRITPDELHCNDPLFYDTVYSNAARREKAAHRVDSTFSTVNHELHRRRRAAMNRYFSKGSVIKLEPMIHENVDKLCRQLLVHQGTGEPVDIAAAFICFVGDVVSTYAFGKSYSFLDHPSFDSNLHTAMVAGTESGPYVRQLPFIFPIIKLLPDALAAALSPTMKVHAQYQADLREEIGQVQKQVHMRREMKKEEGLPASVFHELFESDLPKEERTVERLRQEGELILGAGIETTGWTLSVLFYHVLNNPEIGQRLTEELETAIPDPCACISEALRLSYGVSSRSPRISPDEPLVYRPSSKIPVPAEKSEYVIPKGTPISLTSYILHHNEVAFPQSKIFDPNRWLDERGQRDRTGEKYMFPFSRGTRQCLGMNLAYAELYMASALVMRRLGPHLSLYETRSDDVEMRYDLVVPRPKLDSKGIRVMID